MTLLLGSLALLGCGEGSVTGLDSPEELTLYSLNPADYEPGKEPQTEEKFHGYPVLGKIAISDASQRKALAMALKSGLAHSDGKMAKCFWPRHAIRTVEKGHSIDYVICFECYQLVAHEGTSDTIKPVTREPQALFNEQLKQAGIPLAP
jgi:hypothetical protein